MGLLMLESLKCPRIEPFIGNILSEEISDIDAYVAGASSESTISLRMNYYKANTQLLLNLQDHTLEYSIVH